MTTYID